MANDSQNDPSLPPEAAPPEAPRPPAAGRGILRRTLDPTGGPDGLTADDIQRAAEERAAQAEPVLLLSDDDDAQPASPSEENQVLARVTTKRARFRVPKPVQEGRSARRHIDAFGKTTRRKRRSEQRAPQKPATFEPTEDDFFQDLGAEMDAMDLGDLSESSVDIDMDVDVLEELPAPVFELTDEARVSPPPPPPPAAQPPAPPQPPVLLLDTPAEPSAPPSPPPVPSAAPAAAAPAPPPPVPPAAKPQPPADAAPKLAKTSGTRSSPANPRKRPPKRAATQRMAQPLLLTAEEHAEGSSSEPLLLSTTPPPAPASPTPHHHALPADWGLHAAPDAETPDPSAIAPLIAFARQRHARAIHLDVGAEPALRLASGLVPIHTGPLRRDAWERLLRPICDSATWARWQHEGRAETAQTIAPQDRVRVVLTHAHGGPSAVVRPIPSRAPSLGALGLPPELSTLTEFSRGLVLITGPPGSGRTTTAIALVDLLNRRRRAHIITLEAPIEYHHEPARSLIHQRQIGQHASSYPDALAASLRENPDILFVGDVNHSETIALALRAAEQGMLVIGIMPTLSATATLQRILDLAPKDAEGPTRALLADHLRTIISQRLLPSADGEQALAVEALWAHPDLADLLRDGDLEHVRAFLHVHASDGMCTLDQTLARLVREGTLTLDTALTAAVDAKQVIAESGVAPS